MDPSRLRLNRVLHEVLEMHPYSSDIQYLIDSLENIKNNDEPFIEAIRINQLHRDFYDEYSVMDQTVFKLEYRNMNFLNFEMAYNENYFIHCQYLTSEDMETFDWESEFK